MGLVSLIIATVVVCGSSYGIWRGLKFIKERGFKGERAIEKQRIEDKAIEEEYQKGNFLLPDDPKDIEDYDNFKKLSKDLPGAEKQFNKIEGVGKDDQE